MTVKHPNFYENIKEAAMRLQDTVVLYDGRPYYVYWIADHKDDGIFRMYLDDLLHKDGLASHRMMIPQNTYDTKQRGVELDAFLDKNPDCGMIRKMMNSPAFDRFRPFPLGMCNHGGSLFYLERSPTRHTQQGLTQNIVTTTQVSLADSILNAGRPGRQRGSVSIMNRSCAMTITGSYPDAPTVLKKLLDPGVLNEGVAFCREFAFIRGPLNLIFMAYKTEVVGFLPYSDFSSIRLEKSKRHLIEKIDGLRLFDKIEA